MQAAVHQTCCSWSVHQQDTRNLSDAHRREHSESNATNRSLTCLTSEKGSSLSRPHLNPEFSAPCWRLIPICLHTAVHRMGAKKAKLSNSVFIQNGQSTFVYFKRRTETNRSINVKAGDRPHKLNPNHFLSDRKLSGHREPTPAHGH